MAEDKNAPDFKMDPAALYQDKTYTDRKVGAIRELTPVKVDGTVDPTRQVVYEGQAQLMTSMGTLPLAFEIEAGSLQEAISKFADATKHAAEQTMQQLQQMQRESSSSIITPDSGGFGGGIPDGGGIKRS